MNDVEFIDDYFNKNLSAEEIKVFDERVQQDPAFAEEVAFYYSVINDIKSKTVEQKKERFKEIYKSNSQKSKAGTLRTLWPYVAAAAIVATIIAGLFIFTQPSSSKLADQYIQEHFKTLSVTMSSKEDEMQKGLRLYNENKLSLSLEQFEKILRSDTSNFVALKNAGIVCLRLNQYDKALGYFQQMAAKQGYNSNPGLLYQAITLLKRGAQGDKLQAQQLLQQVVTQGLEGKEDAQRFLR